MALRIFKYRLETNDTVVLELPTGAKILTVQVQHGNPFIWALIDDEAIKEKRVFEVFGTGHTIEPITELEIREYIGTYQLFGGNLIFHVFERVMPF